MAARCARRWAFLISCSLLTFGAADSFAAVGRTVGQPSISTSGEAQYSIPLWTPPGTNGLQPSLALVYSSSSGNGLLGMGWSISGLSAITRCGQTFAQDNAIVLPGLAYTDKFCLDGGRLRMTSTGTSYGQDGSTYQTEIESFTRITAKSVAGQGPEWFEVRTKDGLILEYGRSISSLIEPLAGGGGLWPTPRAWALNKISDRSNNYIEFTYTEDATYGGYRPDEIRWTGNTNGTSPQYTVKFNYEGVNRPDIVVGYRFPNVSGVNGQDTQIKRLDYINVLNGTTIVRKYDVTWRSPGGAGDRSLIESITECGLGGADCYAPTTLWWHSGTLGWNTTETNSGQSIPSGVVPMVMDISGDGRDDLVYSSTAVSGSGVWCYMLGTSTGFASQSCTSISNTNYSLALPIQWDGDDKRDILVPSSANIWQVLRANGNGFDPASSTTISSVGSFWVADVDGDTRGDLIRGSNTAGATGYCQIWVRLRSGINFGAENLGFQCDLRVKLNASAPFGLLEYKWRSATKWPDFDGDSREDLLIAVTETDPEVGTTQYGKPLFGLGTSLGDGGETNSPVTGTSHWRFGDMNGDGLTDLMVGRSGSVVFRYSGGSGWIFTGMAANSSMLMTDWDSDGLDDYVVASGSPVNWHWARNTGMGFQGLTNSGLAAASSPVAATGDLTGDGLHDLVRADGTVKYRAHQGVRPDLLDWIKDGFEVKADFDYAPLTDPGVYAKSSNAQFPTREYQGSMHVVKKYTFTNGAGGDSFIDFTYSGARIHGHGRGFLGFAKRMQVDSRNGIYTEENFQQNPSSLEYAYIGTLSSTLIKQSSGSLYKIREVINTWSNIPFSEGTWNERRFPYVSTSVAKDYEVGGTYNGTHIRTLTTTTTMDTWGTPANVVQTTREEATGLLAGTTHEQRVTHPSVSNEPSTWCLSKPTQTQFINSHTLNGGTQLTRTVNRAWDTAKCRLTQEVVEPSSATLQVTTEYFYDDDSGESQPDFGNLVRVKVTPVGQSARTTLVDWGTSGQFPLTITDTMSKATNLAWIGDRGLLNTVTDPNSLTVDFDYDNFNRKTRELRPDSTATRWSFGACSSPSYCGESTLRHYVLQELRTPYDTVAADRYVYFDAFDREKYDEPLSLSGTRAVIHTVYDALGRLSTRSVPFISGSSDPYKVVTFTYDLLNRLKKAEREEKEGVSTLQSTEWTYEGFSVSQKDALGRTTTGKLSAIGQVLQLIDAGGTDTDYEHDAFGNLVKTRDINSNEITIEYNIRGFKTKLSDPDLGSNWIYDYFPLGGRCPLRS